MNLQNTPWDYQEHDRIISILAWVVVVVLVIYASVFFYKEITSSPERPSRGQPPATAQGGPETQGSEPVPVIGADVGGDAITNLVPPSAPPPVAAPPPPPVVAAPPPPPRTVPPPVVAAPPPPPVAPPPPVVVPPPPPVVAAVPPPPVPPPPPPPTPRNERITLKIGKFGSAGEAVRTGVELGIDGHSFTPVRDPLTNRYTLHFGEFTIWKDAIGVMDAIKAKNAALDVVIWKVQPATAAESPPDETRPAPAVTPPPRPEPARPPAPASVGRPRVPASGTATAVSPRTPAGPFVVRVGSYKMVENARSLVKLLGGAGYRATMDQTTVNGARWYRVHVGGYGSADEAQRAVSRIISIGKVTGGATVVKL